MTGLMAYILAKKSMRQTAKSEFDKFHLTAAGPIDANNSVGVDLGDFTFRIAKNDNNWFATGWVKKKDPSSGARCYMAWQSAWGSNGQWYVYDWIPDANEIATDTDLGYGASPSRGGSHVIRLFDSGTYKLWTITCFIGGNQDASADYGAVTVDASGAQ